MGKKIDALQLLTSGGIDQLEDLVVVFDSTTQTAKKMTVVDFLSLAQSSLDIGSLTILTGANIDVVDDYLVIRSDADGQLYKVSPKELFTTYTIADLQNLNPNQVVTNQDFIGILDGSTNIYHKISVEHLLSLAPGLDIGALTVVTSSNIDVVDDYLVIRSDADGELYKVSPQELFKTYTIADLQNLNANQVVGNEDYIGILDGSANVYHKISVSALLSLASSGGLVNFTEAATTTQVSLEPNSTHTNVSIALQPKGTGAFQLRKTGNTRGVRAVDLQMFDTGSLDIAGAPYSSITGGYANTITPDASYARAGGIHCYVDQYGADVWSSGSVNNTSDGANQFMRILMRRLILTGAQPFDLFTFPSVSIRPWLYNSGTIWYVLAHVTVKCVSQGNGTVPENSMFCHSYKFGIKNNGGATSIIGSVQQIGTAIADAAMSNVSIAITADDTDEAIRIVVTVPNGGTTGQFNAMANLEINQVL
jgi:hypothetical protein